MVRVCDVLSGRRLGLGGEISGNGRLGCGECGSWGWGCLPIWCAVPKVSYRNFSLSWAAKYTGAGIVGLT